MQHAPQDIFCLRNRYLRRYVFLVLLTAKRGAASTVVAVNRPFFHVHLPRASNPYLSLAEIQSCTMQHCPLMLLELLL